MARNRAFRPQVRDAENRLEDRLALSHASIHHLIIPHAHAGGHRHRGPHAPGGHAEAHSAAAPTSTTTSTHAGTTAQSTVTLPIVVLPESAPTPPTAVPTVPGVMSDQESAIVGLVNLQRAEAGLAPLLVSPQLVEAAQIQSADMAASGLMEHTLPGAALPALQDRAAYVGYNYAYLGENIAFNYPDANSVMDGWMNSPGHRANILDPNYTQIGVGIAYDSQGQPYYTEDFGQPASTA